MKSLFVKSIIPMLILAILVGLILFSKTISIYEDIFEQEIATIVNKEIDKIDSILKGNFNYINFLEKYKNIKCTKKDIGFIKKEIFNEISENKSPYSYILIYQRDLNRVVFRQKIDLEDKKLKELIDKRSGNVTINGAVYRYKSYYFEPFNWDMLFLFDKTPYMNILESNKNNLIFFILIVLFASFVVLALIQYFLIKRPINRLIEHFSSVKYGLYEKLSLDLGSDEFNQFASNVNKLIKSIKSREDIIQKKVKELNREKNFSKDLLNSQQNIIFVGNNSRISEANKSFFKFFNQYKTISDFEKEHKSISDYFEKEDGYIYDFEKKNWFDYIVEHPEKTHKVKIKKDNKTYTFVINVNKVTNEDYIVSLTDVTDMEKYEKEIEKTNKLLLEYKKVVDVSAIVSKTDIKGRITYVNRAFEEMSGYSSDELIGKTHNMLRHPDTPKELFVDLWRTILSKKTWRGQIKNRKKNGDYYVVNATISPIVDNFGKIVEFIALRYDVTDIFKAKERAERAERAKSIFLANMSHEIRTPLNAIIGFTKLILRQNPPQKIKKHLVTIDNSAELLLKIINDILDLSKIESQKVELEMIEFEPLEFFEQSAELFRAKAQEKSISYNIFIDPKLPVCIVGDKFKLKQILSNFIGNAIKFTPENGKIDVAVTLKDIDDKKCKIEFSVKDSGVGIPEDKQNVIFEAFAQADNSVTRKYGGTGLGLAISNNFVKAMGSKIEIESKEGEGSRFYFSVELDICELTNENKDALHNLDILIYTKENDEYRDEAELLEKFLKSIARVDIVYDLNLPLSHKYDMAFICSENISLVENDKNRVPICIVTNSDEVKEKYGDKYYILDIPFNASSIYNLFLKLKNLRGKEEKTANDKRVLKFKGKILIAEDNIINQELMSAILDEKGEIEYKMVENGKLALEKVKSEKFDIIFLDIHMPVMDGVEALKNIKKMGIVTPVVALTANVLHGDKREFLENGFDGYLSKPIEEEKLDGVFKKYLEVVDIKEDSGNLKQIHKEDNVNIDFQELAKSMHIPIKVLKRIVNNFFTYIDEDLKRLYSAIESNNLEEVFKTAHKIKGGAANLRFDKIAEISKDIEVQAKKSDKSFDYLKRFEELKRVVEDYKKVSID